MSLQFAMTQQKICQFFFVELCVPYRTLDEKFTLKLFSKRSTRVVTHGQQQYVVTYFRYKKSLF